MTVKEQAKPVVLIVEDNDEARNARADELSAADCIPISVASSDDAVRELRAAPAVDLVLTDVNLSGKPDDQSGIALARFVKATYKDLPVAVYSAQFADDQIVQLDVPFDRILGKGQMDYKRVAEMIQWCRDRALEYRRQRQLTAFEVHSLLRQQHEAQHPPVELLRELRPGAGVAAAVEQALSEAGYRLKLVEADGLVKPVIIWLLVVGDAVEAEVYGQPALYAEGRDDDEAIANLIDLMRLYGAEVHRDAPESIGPALSLTEFLRSVLADSDE
jgi:CheY-like chemotaxis protein